MVSTQSLLHYFLRAVGVVTVIMTMTLAVGLHGATATQSTDGVETNFYGYISDTGSTSMTLAHLQADDPTFSAELVSPQYADDFFSGFGDFTNYDFAADLNFAYIDQIDEADEYMVFAGNLDFYDGVKPGYVIFLSTSQQVFIIVGYQELADDLFDLADLTIQEGAVPEEYAGYVRIEMSDDGSLAPQSGRETSGAATSSGNEFCYNEPAFATLDLNSDNLLTMDELDFWVDVVPETREMIATMKANGYDSVRYAGC